MSEEEAIEIIYQTNNAHSMFSTRIHSNVDIMIALNWLIEDLEHIKLGNYLSYVSED